MKKNGITGVVFIALVVLSLSVLTFGQPMDLCEGTYGFNAHNTARSSSSGLISYSNSSRAVSSDFVEALKDHNGTKVHFLSDLMLEKMIPSYISDLEIENLKVPATPAGEKAETSERNPNNPLGFVLR
jgi:hypothetical protein